MSKIVLCGGGTGGHLKPILTLAEALLKLAPDSQLTLVTDKGNLSQEIIGQSKLAHRTVLAGKWRRYGGQSWRQRLTDYQTWLLNLGDIFKLLAGIIQTVVWFIRYKPDVVFVKGGYVGLPVGIAAWLLGVPLIIHESDVRAGLTNRLLAPLAKTVAVGWPAANYPKWQHKRLVFSGNLVDPNLTEASAAQTASFFKFKGNKPTLLFIGGSSGAQLINQFVGDHLEALTRDFQVIHLTGTKHYQIVKAATSQKELANYRLYAYLTDKLKLAYQSADIIISRAGANTLAELALLGKPSIIIPHRYSPAGHQTANARELHELDAAIVIAETDVNKKLMQAILNLTTDKNLQQSLKSNFSKLAKPEAVQTLAQEIVRLV